MFLKRWSVFGLGYSLVAGLVVPTGLASSSSSSYSSSSSSSSEPSTVGVSECADLATLNAALQIGDVTAEFEQTVSCTDWTTVTDFVVGGVGDADGYELTVVAKDLGESGEGRGKVDLVNIRFEVWSSLIVVPDVAFGSSATAPTDPSYLQEENGGALAVSFDGNVLFEGDASFSNLHVDGDGGAWHTFEGAITVMGRATFRGCSSTGTGGAVSTGWGHLGFRGGITATDNYSTTAGGAIYNYGYIKVGGAKSYFKRNNSWDGAAVYNGLNSVDEHGFLTFKKKVVFIDNGDDEAEFSTQISNRTTLTFRKYVKFLKGRLGLYTSSDRFTVFQRGGLFKNCSDGAIYVSHDSVGIRTDVDLKFENNSGGDGGCSDIAYGQQYADEETVCGP